MTGASLLKKEGRVSLDTTDVKEVLPIRTLLQQTQGISFVLLRLKDKEGKTLSQNVYWMSPVMILPICGRCHGPCTDHRTVIGKKAVIPAGRSALQMSLPVGFLPESAGNSGGEEVLPSFWSDNYFSIPADSLSR